MRIGEPIEEARFAGPSRIVAATGVGTVESLPLPGGMGAPWSVPVVPGRDDISVNDTAGVVAIPGNDQERFTPLLYAAADGRAIELGQYPASSVPLDVVELSNGGDLITVGGGRRAPFVARLGESEPVLLTPGSRFSERGAASSLRFSPDDRYIALGRPSGALDVFDLAIGQQILVLKEHSASVNSIAFSPDGALVATASDDATIRIFTFPAGEPLLTLRGHFGRVRDAQFTLDGSRMVSVGDDRTVRVWDVASGAEILEVEAHSETISSVDVHPNGRWVLTGSRDRTARVLTLDTDELLEIARSRLPDRSFTPEECTRYGIADCPT